jgi:hypothetical protein
VWYTIARLPSTHGCSNNDPPSWPYQAPAQFFNSIYFLFFIFFYFYSLYLSQFTFFFPCKVVRIQNIFSFEILSPIYLFT